MTVATDTLALLTQLARRTPLPAVHALHLPPAPLPGGLRGEFCAVALEAEGAVGLSYVLLDDTWAGLSAQRVRYLRPGQDALDLAQRLTSADPLARTVALATVNALTRWLFLRTGYTPPASADSLGGLDPQPGEPVGMVGHFTPLLPRITARGAQLVVLELRADLVGERDGVRVTLDPSELAACRQVLATGTLLLNDTLDTVLAHCRHARHLALIGPSVGGPPEPLFSRGVTLLGGTWLTDVPAHLAALVAGVAAPGTARKSAITRGHYPGWTALLDRL
jgi:uncharacterized protein (DUF4213/DUF364 family)